MGTSITRLLSRLSGRAGGRPRTANAASIGAFSVMLRLLECADGAAVADAVLVKLPQSVAEAVQPVIARPLGVDVLGPERAARGLRQGLNQMRAAVRDPQRRAVGPVRR